MKILLLVHHASSGTDDMSLSDRYRPLEARGERVSNAGICRQFDLDARVAMRPGTDQLHTHQCVPA